MLCSKHYLDSLYFCISDCCLFTRRKCQQCINDDDQDHRFKGSYLNNSSFFDLNQSEQVSKYKKLKSLDQTNHQLLNYENLQEKLKEIVGQIAQEFSKVVDNQNVYLKIHQIFNIIKEKIKLQLDQAEQHILYSLKQFYSNIHKSDLSHKINILLSKLNSNQPQNNNPQPTNKNNFNDKTSNQQNGKSNFLSFSNKYLDEFIADLILSNSQQRSNNPFSPLEIENQKLKEIFKKLKDLTYVAENFSNQSIGFLFEEKGMPEVDLSVKEEKGLQQSKYKTNVMHQHSMQVKCVQNLGNQFIVSCGFDKKIKISTTFKDEKHTLVEDIQLKHNIVCTDLIGEQFVCGNEIGGGLLFNQNQGSFEKVREFKLHDSLVYAIRFLNRDEIISGSINELCVYNITKMKKSQCIKYSNNIITEICKLNDCAFLVGDSAGTISYYKQHKSTQHKLTLLKQYKMHKRPIIKIETLSKNRNHIISASRDHNIIIFNLLNSSIEKQILIQNPLVTLCLLSSFEIVSSDSNTIYFHNILTGDLIYKIIPQQNSISCIDCNPLTKTIYIGQGKQVCSIQFS